MNWIDWIPFAIPVAIVIAAAIKAQRYVHGVADFFSAGRIFAILAAACALGAPAASVKVDFAKETGPVKPVNGVGQPPMIGMNDYPMFHYLKDAGIPFSRLHDVGGMFGRGIFVDIPNLFRDFDADETDPSNYDFAFTDLLVGKLVENGVEPFFRLGVTIENFPEVRRYRIDPPKDFAKWARICEHVIRHYTEGWADGFHHRIPYWEIWNEPENLHTPEINQMWHGSFEDYCRLYEVASKHLKAAFPHLKIGGPAISGVQAAFQTDPSPRDKHRLESFHRFLAHVREHDCPLDFFSYHSYDGPDDLGAQVAYVREQLDAAGFAGVETCLNEWLPTPSHDKLGTARQAAEIAATLLLFQNGPVDSAAIYDARCNTGDYSPLFNPLTYKPHKAYYAFMAFNELRKAGTAVSATSDDKRVWIAAAKGDDRRAAMVVNCSAEAVPFSLEIAGDPKWTTARFCRIVDDTRTWEKTPLPAELPPWSFLCVECE